MSYEPIYPPDLYCILIEWHKEGICSLRYIVSGVDPLAIFQDFSKTVLDAAELVYSPDLFYMDHRELAGLFKMVEGYPIPDGDDDSLTTRDVLPAMAMLLKNEKSKIEQGVAFADLVKELNLFLEIANMSLLNKSYLDVTRAGWLPEFGNQLIERELEVFRSRHRMENVWEEKACWFGRLSMLMAMQGPWLGANAYIPSWIL